ncbi:MAG: TIGR00366 family protein [Myxococcales bacterium]
MSAADLPTSLTPQPSGPDGTAQHEPEGALARLSARLTELAERFIPDAFVFAMLATFLVIVAAIAFTPAAARDVVRIWGDGFWELNAFTMQMVLIIITGYVVATSPVAQRVIARIALLPRSPRAAVATVALFSMAASWINWGFSLIFGAMLAKEVARTKPDVDYRALAASAFLGLGSVWAQGLSGSAALQMATASSLPAAIRDIVSSQGRVPGGVIGLEHTIFLWQSVLSVAVEIPLVCAVMYFATPVGARAKSAAQLGIELPRAAPPPSAPAKKTTLGDWLEHARILNLGFVALAAAYFVHYFADKQQILAAINFNLINLLFLSVGVLAHGTPARLMKAFKEATPGAWAVMLQYPFYAGIAAVVSKTHLNSLIAHWFVSISSARSFPALIAVYSAVLGVLVPSGGSKWVIEAPYVMQAAHELKVHLGWMVAVYDLGEALANLVQPFWMLPVLGLLRLRARDVMGYTFLVFLVLTPTVLTLVTLLGPTLPYPL